MTAATVEQSFLATMGLAPSAPVLLAESPPAPPDDPAPWTDPERGGFADGFAATVDELFDVEKRMDQGAALIAEHTAAQRPVPAGWRVRLQSLTTKRAALRKDLAAKHPRALAATAAFVDRLNRQEEWLRQAGCPLGVDPRLAQREDAWLATLAAYERLSLAIDRAFETVADVAADDPASVSWVRAWDELRALGFADRSGVEAAIGGWDADPREVVRRAKAVRPRGYVKPETPKGLPAPPLVTVAGAKGLMNRIADETGLPAQFDARAYPIARPRG